MSSLGFPNDALPIPHPPSQAQTNRSPHRHIRRQTNHRELFAADRRRIQLSRPLRPPKKPSYTSSASTFFSKTTKFGLNTGSGFQTIDLPGLGKICVAICMDLNPHRFETPFEAYELTTFCKRNEVDLLIMPMAWNLPSDERVRAAEGKGKGRRGSKSEYDQLLGSAVLPAPCSA